MDRKYPIPRVTPKFEKSKVINGKVRGLNCLSSKKRSTLRGLIFAKIKFRVDKFSRLAFSNISRGLIFANAEYRKISRGLIFANAEYRKISRGLIFANAKITKNFFLIILKARKN